MELGRTIKFEYLCEFESIFFFKLGFESGDQEGSLMKKGLKSHVSWRDNITRWEAGNLGILIKILSFNVVLGKIFLNIPHLYA